MEPSHTITVHSKELDPSQRLGGPEIGKHQWVDDRFLKISTASKDKASGGTIIMSSTN